MKKIGTYLLATALLLSLAGCAPKRYERKHSPVGASSVKKSSDQAQEKEKTEEAKSDENDKEAIGTLSKADQADIYSIIENSASLTYSLQVQPTRLLELNNDHSAVEGYSQDMFIDYYNPYRRFVLKRNNKNYKGGTHKTRFYVDSTEFVKS